MTLSLGQLALEPLDREILGVIAALGIGNLLFQLGDLGLVALEFLAQTIDLLVELGNRGRARLGVGDELVAPGLPAHTDRVLGLDILADFL